MYLAKKGYYEAVIPHMNYIVIFDVRKDIVKKYDGIFEYKVYEDHLIFMISIYNNW